VRGDNPLTTRWFRRKKWDSVLFESSVLCTVFFNQPWNAPSKRAPETRREQTRVTEFIDSFTEMLERAGL